MILNMKWNIWDMKNMKKRVNVLYVVGNYLKNIEWKENMSILA